jgi:hypothetical protein
MNRNANIGADVCTFKDYYPPGMPSIEDAATGTAECRPDILIKAARNMRHLTKASFTANPLAIEVITNLPSYSQLTDLSIKGFKPEEHIWSLAPTALNKLHWTIPIVWRDDGNIIQAADFLIKVAENTCPNLESLDISFANRPTYIQPVSPASADSTDRYRQLQHFATPKLVRLRHFGLGYMNADGDRQIQLKDLILEFVTRYSRTLKSVFPSDKLRINDARIVELHPQNL